MRVWATLAVFFCSVLRSAAQHSIAYMDNGRSPARVDLIKTEAPAYPEVAKRWRVEGAGQFRVTLNPTTSRVANVAVLKSTGYRVLDASAIKALRGWRWRPGSKWRQVDIPIRFVLSEQGRSKRQLGHLFFHAPHIKTALRDSTG